MPVTVTGNSGACLNLAPKLVTHAVELRNLGAEFIITVGFIKNPAIRINLYNRVKEARGKLAAIVASTAHVSKYNKYIEHKTQNITPKTAAFINIEHNAAV